MLQGFMLLQGGGGLAFPSTLTVFPGPRDLPFSRKEVEDSPGTRLTQVFGPYLVAGFFLSPRIRFRGFGKPPGGSESSLLDEGSGESLDRRSVSLDLVRNTRVLALGPF